MDFVEILRLPRTVQNARRVQEILGVLAWHGAADLLRRVGLRSRRRIRSAEGPALHEPGLERRIRLAFQELGPTFIKLGQLLACRADVVGVPLARELRHLQDRAPALRTLDVQHQIEREFQKPVPEIFAEFDDTPLAAASIAQVHRARLHSGETVAVKVRRPGLSEIVGRDLDIMAAIAHRLDERGGDLLPFSALELIDEFARGVRQEVDLRREARHLLRYAELHRDDPAIRCARVFPELCGERVLTVEFVDGVRPDDLDALDRLGVDRKELARSLLRSTAEDVLEHGFFHADPHPGNLLVRSGPVITPIDLGLIGRFGRRQRDDLVELLAAVFEADSPRVVDLLDRMEILPAGGRRGTLERDVQELIDRFTGSGLQRIPLAQLLGDLLDVLSRHAVMAPSEFFLLARSFAIVEGLVRELAPEMDPVEELKPVATRLYLDRVSDPAFLGRDWTRTARRTAGFLRRAPARFDALLEQLETGRLRFQVASSADPEALVRLGRGSRRIALAVLASAGFLGSTLLLLAAAGPPVSGLPLTHWLGFGGLAVSATGGAAVAIGALISRRG